MVITKFIILQIIAHILADFTLQPAQKAIEKNDLGFKSKFLKWHILVVFGLSWILSFQLNFVFGAVAISLTHWLVDGLKRHINNHKRIGKYAFFIDQLVHLIFIVAIAILFNKYFGLNPFLPISISIKHVLIIAGFIVCAKSANILIKEILNVFEISFSDNNDLPNAGKLIGIIERFLVLTFILLNQFAAVGFLIAAKSILRFKPDETLKSEYVLIGTMLSFGIAIAVGVFINRFNAIIP